MAHLLSDYVGRMLELTLLRRHYPNIDYTVQKILQEAEAYDKQQLMQEITGILKVETWRRQHKASVLCGVLDQIAERKSMAELQKLELSKRGQVAQAALADPVYRDQQVVLGGIALKQHTVATPFSHIQKFTFTPDNKFLIVSGTHSGLGVIDIDADTYAGEMTAPDMVNTDHTVINATGETVTSVVNGCKVYQWNFRRSFQPPTLLVDSVTEVQACLYKEDVLVYTGKSCVYPSEFFEWGAILFPDNMQGLLFNAVGDRAAWLCNEGSYLHKDGWIHSFGSAAMLTLSKDGETIAYVSKDKKDQVWFHPYDMLNDCSRDEDVTFPTSYGHIQALDFSPNAAAIAIATWANRTTLYSLFDMIALGDLCHESNCVAVKFSPNGRIIAVGTWDGSVHLWKVQ